MTAVSLTKYFRSLLLHTASPSDDVLCRSLSGPRNPKQETYRSKPAHHKRGSNTHRRSLHLPQRHPPPKRHKEPMSKLINARLLLLQRSFLITEVSQVVRDREARWPLASQCAALCSRKT